MSACEDFPVWERAVAEEKLEVRTGRRWQSFVARCSASARRPAGQTVDAPLVFFDAQTVTCATTSSFLRGQAVVHWGCHIEAPNDYRRLMEADPALLLFVDIAMPAMSLADGLFPAYVQAYGRRTTVNVAYQMPGDGSGTGDARAPV